MPGERELIAQAQYAHRDIITQGDYYLRHIEAMTREGLHDKGDIAAELAHRDERIAALEALLREVVEGYKWMRDNGYRTPLLERIEAALGGSK